MKRISYSNIVKTATRAEQQHQTQQNQQSQSSESKPVKYETHLIVYPPHIVNVTPDQLVDEVPDSECLAGITGFDGGYSGLYRYIQTMNPDIYRDYEKWCGVNGIYKVSFDILRWAHQYLSPRKFEQLKTTCIEHITLPIC
jgi:hypothetical protein